jgi:hypothetical protein
MGMQAPDRRKDFWADKTPCWIFRGCVAEACDTCPAFYDRSRPCWEQDTLCKRLLDMDSCFACEVYQRYAPSARPADKAAPFADAR